MDKIKKLGLLFSQLANELNISNTLYDKAVTAYTALANYIKDNNSDWDVEVFPQGSFELGTVIKPINDEDQYDVDLVVLVKMPSFEDAYKLRQTIQSFLESHGRYDGKIEEKKQCLRIVYSDSAQFHMDVVCAVPTQYNQTAIINVAKKIETGEGYKYFPSNPKGYIEWFKQSMNYKRLMQEARIRDAASTEIQALSLAKMKTPLQQAIQILKRHRDIFFQNNLDSRPSSIIITTLCALSYDNAKIYNSENNNVYTTIKQMLNTFTYYLGTNSFGEYKLSNPSFDQENFLYKWNSNSKLPEDFFKWIEKARFDIITNPLDFLEDSPTQMRDSLRENFGHKITDSALKKYGEAFGLANESGQIRINPSTMSIAQSKDSCSIVPMKNTFFGD